MFKVIKYLVVLALVASAQGVLFDDLGACQDAYNDYRDAYSTCRDEADSWELNVSRNNLSCLDAEAQVGSLSKSLNELASLNGNYSLLLLEKNSAAVNLSTLLNASAANCSIDAALTSQVENLSAQLLELGVELNRSKEVINATENEKMARLNVLAEKQVQIEEMNRRLQTGCPDPKLALSKYYDAWVALPAKAKECLPRLLLLSAIPNNAGTIQGTLIATCNLSARSGELGDYYPDLLPVYSGYLKRGFLVVDKDAGILQVADVGGIGCLSMFEDKQRQSSADQDLATVMTALIYTVLLLCVVGVYAVVKYVNWRRGKK